MIENIREYIFKAFTKKNIILSFIFSLILLFFSQHLFLDYRYWVNSVDAPGIFRISVIYDGNKNDIRIKSKTPYAQALYNVRVKNGRNIKQIEANVYNDLKSYIFEVHVDCVKDKTGLCYDLKFADDLKFESIKINDQFFPLEKYKIKNSEIVRLEPGVYNIEFICKKVNNAVQSVNLKNITLACLIFIFYFFLFIKITSSYSSINSKKFLKMLILCINKNKMILIVFAASFLIYILYNFQTSVSSDHFLRIPKPWNPSSWLVGDESIALRNIIFAYSRRFHPYFFLPLYPLFEILMFISKNIYFSLSIIWYLLASLSVVFLYKSLNIIITKLKIIKIIIVLCFLFSLSQLLMSYIFDLYIIAGCYLSIFVYLVLKELTNRAINYHNIILMALISALIFGVNMINLITCLIILCALFTIKKNKNIILWFFLLLILLIGTFVIVKSIVDNSSSFRSAFVYNTSYYMNSFFKISLNENLKYFCNETLLKPLSSSYKFLNPAFIFWFLFIITAIFSSYLYLTKKTDNKYKPVYFSLLIAILYNLAANLFWCPKMGFLFSQNFLVLLFVVFGMSVGNIDCYLKTKNIKYSNIFKTILLIFLIIFLFFEIVLNTQTVIRQHNNAIKYNPQNMQNFIEEKK